MPSKYKLRPSSSARFLQCSKSLEYEGVFQESIHTVKGNLIHDVIALTLALIFHGTKNQPKINNLKKNGLKSRKDASLHATWDADCEETLNNSVDYARRLVKYYKPKEIIIEAMLPNKFYTNKMNGKVDFLLICDDLIIIVDWKTGRGRVEAEDNPQMLLYAYAVIQNLSREGKQVPSKIIISINQSIINNVVAIKYTFKQMVKWYIDQSEQMIKINKNELEYNPSPSACKYCAHKADCNARIKAGVVA